MYKLYPYISNDCSVGLFSPIDDDIYHSVTGAATEAYTKFILPANIDEYLLNHSKIRVLDICFGIGYNSKSFLNYIFQKKVKKNFKIFKTRINILSPYINTLYTNKIIDINNNEKIYSDNNLLNNIKIKYNNSIYNNKVSNKNINFENNCTTKNIYDKKFKISIKAIELDKTLAFLSPFINPQISKNLKNQFINNKISKFKNNQLKSKNLNYEINPSYINYPAALNCFLLDFIMKQHPEIINDNDIIQILSNHTYNEYLSKEIRRIYRYLISKDDKLCLHNIIPSLLHNIYYKHISKRYKSDLNALKTLDIDFKLKINDARQEIKSDTSEYDFIFLDAFTPDKCPNLWSIDFFKLLYDHLSYDGMILTYSNSAKVRNAFLNAGFYIGKIFNPIENKFSGTIATRNMTLIKNELSEFDLGLLKTKAGIFYRDKNLTATNKEIIEQHKSDVAESDLISATAYKKQYNILNKLPD